jgi:putative DNA primase/helicase
LNILTEKKRDDIKKYRQDGHTYKQTIAYATIICDNSDHEAGLRLVDVIYNKTKYTYSDTGNAQRLYDKYGDLFKWIPERRLFIIWNGHAWEYDTPDNTQMNKLAKETVRAIPDEKTPNMADDDFKKLMNFALLSLNQIRIKAMLESVKSEVDVTISAKQLDKDPDLFNCLNLTIDLRTGVARPQSRDDLITITAPVTYDLTATCPQWESWLEQIQDGKYSVINYLQTLCGYCMTGETKTDVIPFCHGLGGNGKSTFWNVIRDNIMGDYAYEVNPDVFLISGQKFKDSGQREELANLFGKRLVTATEIQEGRQLTINLLKAISGGEAIHGDRKYERGITFKPTFKVILSGNNEPVIKDNSNAAWRRLKKIPFPVTIENQIDGFEDTFKNELPGILNWMIAGCMRWRSEGLRDPDEVIQATLEYRNAQDVISQFLDTYFDRNINGLVTKVAFKDKYSKWCEENSYDVLPDRAIKLKLSSLGIKDKHLNTGGVWLGIKPKSDGSDGSDG